MVGQDPRVLLERDAELEIARAALDATIAGEGRLLAFVGPAGIGKTRLLVTLEQDAQQRSVAVLHVRGTELERDFAFGVARQALEPTLWRTSEQGREQLFEGAARLAAPLLGAESLAARTGPGLDPSFAALHGLYWLTANLAAREPLLIAVDDVHWADRASLRWLIHLAARLEGLPVLLAIAARVPEPGVDEPLVASLLDAFSDHAVRPKPLSEGAVRELVEARLGSDSDALFVSTCHAATAGNPFLIEELVAELALERVEPIAANVSVVAELGPASVARSVLARVARLGPECTRLARSVAIFGEGSTLRQVSELAGLGDEEAARAADMLTAAAILRASHGLEFAHPVVRAAVHADIAPQERDQAHRQAARIVAAADGEPARVAAHLLATESGGDEWASEQLLRAAGEAFARGALDASSDYLKRALAESPSTTEVRVGALSLLGWIEAVRNEDQAIEHLSEAFAQSEDPVQRALIARGLASEHLVATQYVKAFEVLDAAIAGLGAEHEELGLRLEGELCVPGWFTREARDRVDRRPKRFGVKPDNLASGLLIADEAVRRSVLDGRASESAQVARAALFDGRLLAEETADSPAFYMVVTALAATDELELVRDVCTELVAEASGRGSLRGRAFGLCFLAGVNFRLGRIADAEADGRGFMELGERRALPILIPCGLSFLIDALRERDELDAAVAALEAEDVSAYGEELLFQIYRHSRGRLRIARGEVDAGLEDLFDCGRGEAAWGVRSTGMTMWRCDAAAAMSARGERDEARRLAEEEVERARAYGAQWPLGIALRTRGMIAGGSEGIELLREAVEVLTASAARLEEARARTELGAAMRRQGHPREARTPLNRGLALARRCGGLALAQRAHDELQAAGARPRKILRSGVDALTASERRVAQMAADGMSNRQIAEALFVTVRTVEAHLHHAYLKLDIGSREQLAAALGRR